MGEIELVDVFILILPILFLNIIFSFRNNFNFKFLKSRFPFVLVSYSFLITTSLVVMIVIFHVHIIGNNLVIHLHNFHSDVLADVASFELDFIAMLILGWCLSIIYSSLLISQLALRLLNKYLSDTCIDAVNPLERLPEETKQLLLTKKIALKMITTEEMGAIFSLSYFSFNVKSFLNRKNFIYFHKSIFSIYSDNEFNAAIVHEIGHIHNMDTIFFPVFNTLSRLMFFDPFLKRIILNYRHKMEEKADFYALNRIKEPKDLAKAIIKSLELMIVIPGKETIAQQNSSILSLGCLNKKVLSERIEKIISFREL